jgi:branched-chain amino acid transport system substrate-binding protein
MRRLRSLAITCLALLGLAVQPSLAADDTIKIGYMDPFSGAFAAGGDAGLKTFQFILDYINAKGGPLGKKYELVTFDDKLQPAEALIALKSITDQNIPFVMSCVGSNVGSALIDAVNKHNARNPDNRVLQLNCGQLATELTNEQCSFWHFRFAGSVEMRAVARIKSLPQSVKSVYMLNQDYLFGQSIEKDTKRFPKTKGWAYAQFLYDPTTRTLKPNGTGSECGFACHTAVSAQDYIFTAYPPR